MILSGYNLKNIPSVNVSIPDERLFELPEKVLQFGTGVLLRGLPDYFIDKANRQGIFNGRIVVVKSTAHGDTSDFDKQDGLYTICIRGIENGERVEQNIINSSISRVLSATDQWEQVLECAHNQAMQVIISNTTEVGIQLMHDDIRHHPPKSFPGKLLSFLYERFKAFGGSERSGMVIIPTELIPDNGRKLESIVLELAHLNSLDEEFIEWLECCNHFCSSLVDRIVPGSPDEQQQQALTEDSGYSDNLRIMTEVYRLWAIEGGDEVKNVLSFAKADDAVKIEPNIDMFRELKLRLLNGTHTLSCGAAFLAGFDTVKVAMNDEIFHSFIANLMFNEIAPAIPYDVDLNTSREFGKRVIDRFRNPYINHHWINITVQYSSKMKMRCIPVLLKHYEKSDSVPQSIALGFAAYILFMKAVKKDGDRYYGDLNGGYLIQDDYADIFYSRWSGGEPDTVVRHTLQDIGFWGTDLGILPGFEKAVSEKLRLIISVGMKEAIETAYSKVEVA